MHDYCINFIKVLNKSSKRLGSYPSFLYVIIYLLLIPTFALAYSNIGNSFYHSTSQYEPYIIEQKADILLSFENDIKENFREYHHNDIIKYNNVLFDINSIDAIGIDNLGDDLEISLRYSIDGKELDYSVPARIKIRNDSFINYVLDGETRWLSDIICDVSELNTDRKIGPGDWSYTDVKFASLVFPSKKAKLSNSEPTAFNIITVNKSTTEKITNYKKALKGFPNKIYGNYFRMLYLSVVTITTLGYGDIVPITDYSRFLIALESIMGVILIGLFLNSLSYSNKD